jgi:hypothetical protein
MDQGVSPGSLPYSGDPLQCFPAFLMVNLGDDGIGEYPGLRLSMAVREYIENCQLIRFTVLCDVFFRSPKRTTIRPAVR